MGSNVSVQGKGKKKKNKGKAKDTEGQNFNLVQTTAAESQQSSREAKIAAGRTLVASEAVQFAEWTTWQEAERVLSFSAPIKRFYTTELTIKPSSIYFTESNSVIKLALNKKQLDTIRELVKNSNGDLKIDKPKPVNVSKDFGGANRH